MDILDVRLYLDRARVDLLAAESNIQQGFYGVAISRAYYSITPQHLRDPREFC